MLRAKTNLIIQRIYDRFFPLVTYWLQYSGLVRTRRDKRTLLIATVFLLVVGYFEFIWFPLSERIKQQDGELQQLISMNHKLITAKPDVMASRHQAKQLKTVSTLQPSQVITNSAAAKSVVIKRIAERGEHVEVWIEPVVFSDLLDWLKALEKQHGLSVMHTDISAGDKPGIVNVQRLEFAGRSGKNHK